MHAAVDSGALQRPLMTFSNFEGKKPVVIPSTCKVFQSSLANNSTFGRTIVAARLR
jgi:hypothetical protein